MRCTSTARSGLVAFLAAAPLVAQNTIVSPAFGTAAEGSSQNNFPWNSTVLRRYMQIHDDIGGSPKVISKISFRVAEGISTFTGTRTYDMELFMGHGPAYPNWSFTFANNYIGAPTQVLTRQSITFGPQGTAVTPGPNPFTANMDLVLPVPFVYDGVRSLVWEAVLHGVTTVGGFSIMDADTSSITIGSAGTVSGTGCIATGRTAAMTHSVSHADMGGLYLANFTVANGPSSAPVLLSIGATNPNLAVPGLCSNLLTDLFQVLLIGTTNAAGAITSDTPSQSAIVAGNTFGGAVLFTQAHALDLARPDPIPLTNSNGRTFTIPLANPTKVDRTARIFNNTGGTAATQGIFFADSSIGHALVTQFTY
jgi:hypothetical protein